MVVEECMDMSLVKTSVYIGSSICMQGFARTT